MVTKLTIKIHTDSHFPDFYWTHPKFKATSYNITLPMVSFFSAEQIIVSSGGNKNSFPRKQKIHTKRSGKPIPSGLSFHSSTISDFDILTF